MIDSKSCFTYHFSDCFSLQCTGSSELFCPKGVNLRMNFLFMFSLTRTKGSLSIKKMVIHMQNYYYYMRYANQPIYEQIVLHFSCLASQPSTSTSQLKIIKNNYKKKKIEMNKAGKRHTLWLLRLYNRKFIVLVL